VAASFRRRELGGHSLNRGARLRHSSTGFWRRAAPLRAGALAPNDLETVAGTPPKPAGALLQDRPARQGPGGGNLGESRGARSLPGRGPGTWLAYRRQAEDLDWTAGAISSAKLPLFCGLTKIDRLIGGALSTSRSTAWVEQAAASAGLDPQRHSGHSLRHAPSREAAERCLWLALAIQPLQCRLSGSCQLW
jgi:hypothetical protein